MMWRIAKSLLKLRSQVDALHPKRSRESDGTIGDAAHASRSSDHNPWVKDGAVGVVTGMDITNDPAHGCSSQELAEVLLASRDDRIKYIISNRHIASGSDGPSPWKWRKYTGANPHDHHVHVSVKAAKKHYDDEREWVIVARPGAVPRATVPAPTLPALPPTLRKGARGADVRRLQQILGVDVDGIFGDETREAVAARQAKHKLIADGVVGPQTWRALLGV